MRSVSSSSIGGRLGQFASHYPRREKLVRDRIGRFQGLEYLAQRNAENGPRTSVCERENLSGSAFKRIGLAEGEW